MPYKLFPPGRRGPCWYVRGTDSGGEFEFSTQQDTRRAAEKWVEEVLLPGRARRRVPGAGEVVGFATAARHYIAAKPHLSKQDIRKVQAVAAEIGEVDCRTLTHAHLVAAAAELKRGRAPATQNRFVIGPGAAVLHYAAENKWCDYQRIRKFEVSRKSNRRPATPETMALLVRHLEDPPEHIAPQWKAQGLGDAHLPYKRILLAILFETGLRLGHALSIEWERIFLADGRIGVDVPKSDELALVPISPVTVTMLANLPEEEKTGRLFPWLTSSGVYPWLKRAKERAGVHYTPHLSRHALATAAQDMPDKKAAELGVWKDPRSLHRYQHVKPEAIPGRHIGTILDLADEKKAESASELESNASIPDRVKQGDAR
jgi:integrase